MQEQLNKPPGYRVVVTGQVGVEKKPYLEQVVQLANEAGKELVLYNVGEMMYREAPDVAAGRILDLPISRLNSLRRAVFHKILSTIDKHENIIVNTHATFRWRHGLFPAFDHDLVQSLKPDLFITMVDNVDAIHLRLLKDHDIDHSLKDILVWREEEILATEVLAVVTGGHGCFYVMARGDALHSAQAMYRLIFQPQRKKVYVSFPMSHVQEQGAVHEQIEQFRSLMAQHFTWFDPGDLEEKRLGDSAVKAAEENRKSFVTKVLGQDVTFDTAEILSVAGDINGQIYARDFKFIEQSDMIVSLIPQLTDGKPLISSGVERELQHAHESAKEVYVIWQPTVSPSPFITQTATKVFKSQDQAIKYFQTKGYIKA